MYASLRKDVDPRVPSREVGRGGGEDVCASRGVSEGGGGERIDYIVRRTHGERWSWKILSIRREWLGR